MHDGDYKWLSQIGDRRFFLPNMVRMYLMSYLQHMSIHYAMDWDLSQFVSGVSLGRLGAKEILCRPWERGLWFISRVGQI